MDRKASLAAALILVVALGGFVYWVTTNTQFGRGISVGDTAVDIQFTTLDGTPFRLSDQRGKVVVVDFITTSCSICVQEFDVLRQLSGRADVKVVSINLDGVNQTFLSQYARILNVTWTVGGSAAAGTDYKVSGVPTLLVVDRGGVIRYRGYYTSFEALDQVISQYG